MIFWYLLVRKRLHTGHRRSALDAKSCPKQSQLSVKQRRTKWSVIQFLQRGVTHKQLGKKVVPHVSLQESEHTVQACLSLWGGNQYISKSEARRGQTRSTEAVWEVLECSDCYLMFSRPDSISQQLQLEAHSYCPCNTRF